MEEPNPFADESTRHYGTTIADSIPDDVALDITPVKTSADIPSASTYADYYQVDYEKLRARIKCAIAAKSLKENEGGEELEPELYAPVWVTVCAGLAGYVARGVVEFLWSLATGQAPLQEVGQHRLAPGLLVAFFYTWGCPLVVRTVARVVLKLDLEGTLLTLVTIYGYSLVVWVPIVVLRATFSVLRAKTGSVLFMGAMLAVQAAGIAHSVVFFHRQLKACLLYTSRCV